MSFEPNDSLEVEMTETSPAASQREPLHGLDESLMHSSALTHSAAPHTAAKKNSLFYDIFMAVLVIVLLVSGLITLFVANNWRANDPYEIAKIYMEKHPFIDGKNQLPYAIKTIFKGDVTNLNLNEAYTVIATDIPKTRKGKLGGAVWSAMTPCGIISGNEGPTAVENTLNQIDIIYQLIEKYQNTLETLTDPALALDVFGNEKLLPSMIAIEGGHQIHDDLAVLRMYQKLGAVSMGLTLECSTAWAQTGNPYNTQYSSVQGLTDFGVSVVEEMNRVGMMVDLSRTALATMTVALEVSEAPVIFSLSGAYALCNSSLNVPDSLFNTISQKGGVIMVPFFPPAICSWASVLYDRYRSGAISAGTLVQQYYAQLTTNPCGIEQVFSHVDYIKTKIGPSHVGLSTNFDFNLGLSITGLEDTSKLINMTARFVEAGYSENDITNIIGGNLLRAWTIAKQVSHDILASQYGAPVPRSLWGDL